VAGNRAITARSVHHAAAIDAARCRDYDGAEAGQRHKRLCVVCVGAWPCRRPADWLAAEKYLSYLWRLFSVQRRAGRGRSIGADVRQDWVAARQ